MDVTARGIGSGAFGAVSRPGSLGSLTLYNEHWILIYHVGQDILDS